MHGPITNGSCGAHKTDFHSIVGRGRVDMASRDTFSRDVEFGQLMVRVTELLDAEDGYDEKSLNLDGVALAVGRLALWVAGHKKDVKDRRAKGIP